MADRRGEGQLIVDSRIQIFLDTLNGVLPSLIRELSEYSRVALGHDK
jgi:hypothetical protein